MVTVLTFIFGLFVFFLWLWSGPSKDADSLYSNKTEEQRLRTEEHNYEDLRLLFIGTFSDYPQVNSGFIIEACLNENKRIIFGAYSNGFTGYYLSCGGGVIGGKWYAESVYPFLSPRDLMHPPFFNGLGLEFQMPEIQSMAKNLNSCACDLHGYFVQDNNIEWLNNSDRIKLWLLTQGEGEFPFTSRINYFSSEVNKLDFQNSNFKELIINALELILESNKSEGSVHAEYVSNELSSLFNL